MSQGLSFHREVRRRTEQHGRHQIIITIKSISGLNTFKYPFPHSGVKTNSGPARPGARALIRLQSSWLSGRWLRWYLTEIWLDPECATGPVISAN